MRMRSTETPWPLLMGRAGLLTAVLLLMAYPVFWVTAAAVKSKEELIKNPFGLPSSVTLEHLKQVWLVGDFSLYFRNSLIVSVISVSGLVVICAMAGYALSRVQFRHARWLFAVAITGLFIPDEVLLIPVSQIFSALGLQNSLLSLIFVYLSWTPFGIFVLRAYFLSIPRELEEAARMDGCGEYGIFWRIYFPLAGPALVTIAIFYFLWTWNNLVWPLVLLQDPESYTLQQGVLRFKDQFTVNYSAQIAALAVTMWPPLLVYLALRTRIQKGLTAGAFK